MNLQRLIDALLLKNLRSQHSDVSGSDVTFDRLREKWSEVPAGFDRIESKDLLNLSDQKLAAFYLTAKLHADQYRDLDQLRTYYDLFKGKKILEVGSGLGFDGIPLALHGASMTFLDIVKDNLQVLERLCRIFGLTNVEFVHMENLETLKSLPSDFDVIWCCGSLIHAPFDLIRTETHELIKHLKPEGRWIELCYPKKRWKREGRMPFTTWGEKTDGGAPWVEWYDLEKMKRRFDPLHFEVLHYYNFHNDDFNWFDLTIKQ